jgi:hypothetical protein
MSQAITLQIFTGGYAGESASFDEVRRKLDATLPRLKVSRIIIGWAPRPGLYEAVADHLAGTKIELYLWLPVFSETGLLRQCAPTVGASGRATERYQAKAGESFDFYCPVNPTNSEQPGTIFREHFASGGFQGVFLDKIRYPSFANGLDGGLSCFCPDCRAVYQRAGLDIEQLRAQIDNLATLPTPFSVTSYHSGTYDFADELWAQFFDLRSQLVFEALSRLTGQFRDWGYRIGMDVFAPFLSQFVGQDIPRLSSLCDFVKPMMYRATFAPAGLPFELEAMLSQIKASPSARASYADLLGLDQERQPFDLDFAVRDLAELSTACACPVQAGLEINHVPGVAEVGPDYIHQTLPAYLKAASGGVVLSWNLLDAPEANLTAVINHTQHWGGS